MKTSDFYFELPPDRIAQYPPERRGQSRLLALNRATGEWKHRMAADLPELLAPGDLLVFNNSKVRKARICGVSVATGAAAEFLLLEQTVRGGGGSTWKALAQRAKRRRPGSRYAFYDAAGDVIAQAEITGADGEFRLLEFDRPVTDDWLDRYGHIPLPPYIKREDAPPDADRYQTVYAAVTGSAAAPTAGLHFSGELLDRIAAAGIDSAFITLHVGLGTFLPVRSQTVEDHRMHEEFFTIAEETAAKIERAKAQRRRVIAVGTTSARALESAWQGDCAADGQPGALRRGDQRTAIFIYPGYQFRVVDALFTNFHTPESTLLMLVSAFAGRELILNSYAEAIRCGYHFFSYGDAMLIE